MRTADMIEAEGLTKATGRPRPWPASISPCRPGPSWACSGPNGAGKTTAVRILTTLATPDGGRATVAGFDIRTQASEVRRHIGVAAQDATLDGMLTGRQNLALIGELSRMGRAASKARATELLERFELTFAADRVLKGYSGGMRRRLDLAASLMTRPPVLVPGRADHRARPHQPPAGVGRHPRTGGRRRHPAADHPVPGRGRHAGRPDHRDRPRAGHRRGHATRAQGGEQGRAPRRHPGRRHTRTRSAHCRSWSKDGCT